MQKGYLARVLSVDGARDAARRGHPAARGVRRRRRDGVAATLEFDADEQIVPVLYVRVRAAR